MRYKPQPAVYKLIIKGTSKTYEYIGQSITVNRRLNQHKCKLKKGNHYNTYLQNAYTKYNNLEIKVLYCDKQYLNILEQTYINVSQCSDVENLNFRRADPNQSGWKMSQKTKDKISKANKGNPQGVNKAHCVGKSHHNYINTVYDFINIFTEETFTGTRKDFMHKLNIHWNKCSDITLLIQGLSKTCRGWSLGLKLPALSDKEWRGASKFRPYIFIKDQEYFEGTITQFRTHYNIERLCDVQRVVNGTRKHTQGWKIRPLGK